MIRAELTYNRKNAQCAECHAILAMRSRQPDGSHVLTIDPDWRLIPGTDDDRFGATWIRDWHRRDSGHASTRHGASERRTPSLPARTMCRCGRIVTLDAITLDVTGPRPVG